MSLGSLRRNWARWSRTLSGPNFVLSTAVSINREKRELQIRAYLDRARLLILDWLRKHRVTESIRWTEFMHEWKVSDEDRRELIVERFDHALLDLFASGNDAQDVWRAWEYPLDAWEDVIVPPSTTLVSRCAG